MLLQWSQLSILSIDERNLKYTGGKTALISIYGVSVLMTVDFRKSNYVSLLFFAKRKKNPLISVLKMSRNKSF